MIRCKYFSQKISYWQSCTKMIFKFSPIFISSYTRGLLSKGVIHLTSKFCSSLLGVYPRENEWQVAGWHLSEGGSPKSWLWDGAGLQALPVCEAMSPHPWGVWRCIELPPTRVLLKSGGVRPILCFPQNYRSMKRSCQLINHLEKLFLTINQERFLAYN